MASANARGRLYLHRGVEMTYTKDLLVEVYLNGLGMASAINGELPNTLRTGDEKNVVITSLLKKAQK